MSDTMELAGRPRYTGAHVTRRQDDALLSGRGTYVADLRRPNMAEIAVVRSTVAHGRITAIRTAEAAAVAGVIAVITAADLTDVSPFPNFAAYTKTPGTFPLAQEKVRYVGAPVAVVLAEDRYIAEDAAELVEVDYDELASRHRHGRGARTGCPTPLRGLAGQSTARPPTRRCGGRRDPRRQPRCQAPLQDGPPHRDAHGDQGRARGGAGRSSPPLVHEPACAHRTHNAVLRPADP